MIRTMSLDLETYSEEDLKKSGAYRYAESPSFEILLLGVSVDDGPVRVYDLASGEEVPKEILQAIVDPNVTKYAFNAAFERICLSTYLRREYPEYFTSYGDYEDTVGNYLSPTSWKCDMVLAAYNGLPLSLEMVGTVLGFEKQKLREGRDLIRYFCSPCKPSVSNGGRIRNLPEHDPDRWKLFKSYNKRDVEVELSIQKRLERYPVPDSVWEEYHLDQQINDRGIAIDPVMVTKAIEIDALTKEDLTKKLQELTGLANPNSVLQMRDWLETHGLPMDSLGKKEVEQALKEAPKELAEVLTLRQQLAKSSVKKYQAMQNAKCTDQRCRGMFQFYGANRSGRWAGRLIQLQNLPKNFISDLAEARDLVKAGQFDTLQLLYENIPDLLSQLIRTAFIPKPGYKFIVADFSSIEARVLAFITGEQHTIDTFAKGEDLYCATASAMFHKPVEKHGINGELRQKGKIATLACIAEGEPVLTDRGLVPIEEVLISDKVWDGESWVRHDGVIYRGEREVITYEGLTATPDHLVWIEGEAQPVYFRIAATLGAHLLQTGDGGRAIRLGDNYQPRETMEPARESLLRPNEMQRVRKGRVADLLESYGRKVQGLSTLFEAPKDPQVARSEAHVGQAALRKSPFSRVAQLRRSWHPFRFSKRYRSWSLSHKNLWSSFPNDGDRPNQQRGKLRQRKSTLRNQRRKLRESALHGLIRVLSDLLALCQKCCDPETFQWYEQRGYYTRRRGCGILPPQELADHRRTARLYDIRNAGPHHRFTVSGKLVHNCGYGGSVGALKAMGALEMGLPEEELQPIVNSWRAANPHIVSYWWEMDAAVKQVIKKKTRVTVGCVDVYWQSGMLFIDLPSGRRLSYVKPRIGENRFGGESVTYMGLDGTKHWSRIESYGPKFVENITQAISRDLLCYSMQNLQDQYICGHIHDEVIIECPMETDAQEICDKMGESPPWLPGIILRADGYETMFYKKD